jgi:hypothetical protein
MLNTTLATLLLSVAFLSSAHREIQPPEAVLPPSRPDIPQIDAYEAREIAGFRVLIHRDLLADTSVVGRRTLAALTWDLELAARLLPEGAVALLQRTTPIWVTPDLPSSGGWEARGLCHHPSKDWLVGAGYGPDRAGAVEVCDVAEYLLWRAEQPLCILHELAHALQHQLGDPAEIRAAFDLAVESGAYERVPFAMIPEDQTRRAYALNNHIEYFAEISEAYFGRNDYFPFTRADLARVDPSGLALVERVWFGPSAPAADEPPTP